MFIDEATIEVKAGAGGRGCVSWRREKYVPMGGPDGGNGGKGGNVYIVADDNTDTLSDFASRKRFEAKEGRFGSGKNRAGRGGDDVELRVPPGTVITETETREMLGELLVHGDRLLVAHGGRGGYGNAHFKSSTRQKPDFAELGEPGELKKVRLELKLIADVGIIGYPSVGKSTLISVVSSAKPKIGDYPFTTLVPNLGVVNVSDRSFIVCDVPGLIEGASEGKGLGDKFLKHIERCGVLLHLLDLSHTLAEGREPDPASLIADYRAIRNELQKYSPVLASKRELVILNKSDVVGGDTASIVKALKKNGITVFRSISAATSSGVADLLTSLLPVVLEERRRRDEETRELMEEERKKLPVLRPHLSSVRMGAYRVDRLDDKSIRISGARLEQFTKMTDFSKDGAIRRFIDVLERIGIMKSLDSLWDGTSPVFIGTTRVENYL